VSWHDHPFGPSVQKWCRVVATIHDCDGRLSHIACPRLHIPSNLIPAISNGHCKHQQTIPRMQEVQGVNDARRAGSTLVSTSTTSTAGNHAFPPSTSAAGASNQQQFGRSVNTGGPPIVEPAVDRSIGIPKPIADPRLQSSLHETRGLSLLTRKKNPSQCQHLMRWYRPAVTGVVGSLSHSLSTIYHKTGPYMRDLEALLSERWVFHIIH